MISREQVLSVLRYNPYRGELYWREKCGGRKMGVPAGNINRKHGYRQIRINGKMYLAHRLIWLIEKGEWPNGDLDHRDTDKLHNRIGNLRPATQSQNQANRGKREGNCSSEYKGVSWNRRSRQWHSYILVRRKRIHLGYFEDETEAAQAYNAAAVQHFGEYARVNKV